MVNESALIPVAVSPAQAASLLSIGRTNLYVLIAAGDIRPVKLGRRTLIPVQQLHDLIARKQAAA
jgi:excisionase family DNA binding protein